MTRFKILPIVSIVVLCLAMFSISADARLRDFLETEFQTSGGYTDNLLADSSNVEDSYGMARLSARVYPLPIVEVELNGDYTNYGNYVDLTNKSGGVGVTIIPLDDDTPLSVYLNGNINTRGYRENYEPFNTQIIDGIASLGYMLSPTMQIRAGFAYKSTSYLNMETIDNTNYEIFGGINSSFFGKNSIDLEIGYAFMDLTYWKEDVWDGPDFTGARYVIPYEESKYPSTEGQLKALYISPRYSRQICDNLAVVLTYSYRKFNDLGKIAVAGVSTQSLSPWSSVYEGESASLILKSFCLPNFILESGIGYWKKDFLNSNEYRNVPLLAKYIILSRHDEQNKSYISIKRPIVFKSGLYMEPAVTLNYSKNNSTNEQYDYSNLSISGGITFRY